MTWCLGVGTVVKVFECSDYFRHVVVNWSLFVMLIDVLLLLLLLAQSP